jgi:phosphopantothenoylcysteine decarboxylase/phosphopantothenate--cysteine ligase
VVARHGEPARVLLGVAGGIAAYKAAEVLRLLVRAGHDVRVLPTAAALRFVGEPTWSALSGHPATAEVFDDADTVPHVRLGRASDLVLVVPATADLLAKAAAGMADDLLTATLLTTRAPVLYAPAMHTEMWEHPATRANVATLRSRAAVVLDPADGALTGADAGPGRLPEPAQIAALAEVLLVRPVPRDLLGWRVVVSAGGTREPLDPVRFLGNRSSGRQGYAVAAAAAARGAQVTLVSANSALPAPSGVEIIPATTTADLHAAVRSAVAGKDGAGPVDAVVMAAAVADFRPADYQPAKIKKGQGSPAALSLVTTVDVLAELAALPAGQRPRTVVGFAAETDQALVNGTAKLAAKGTDLLVVNEVGDGRGFEVDHNAAWILSRDGAVREVAQTSKDLLAHAVWDAVTAGSATR